MAVSAESTVTTRVFADARDDAFVIAAQQAATARWVGLADAFEQRGQIRPAQDGAGEQGQQFGSPGEASSLAGRLAALSTRAATARRRRATPRW